MLCIYRVYAAGREGARGGHTCGAAPRGRAATCSAAERDGSRMTSGTMVSPACSRPCAAPAPSGSTVAACRRQEAGVSPPQHTQRAQRPRRDRDKTRHSGAVTQTQRRQAREDGSSFGPQHQREAEADPGSVEA